MGFTQILLVQIALFLTNPTGVLYACLFVGLPLAGCLGMPVFTIGVRRYTTKKDWGFAFGLSQCSCIFVAASWWRCWVEVILIAWMGNNDAPSFVVGHRSWQIPLKHQADTRWGTQLLLCGGFVLAKLFGSN
jgi:hypothetical protein